MVIFTVLVQYIIAQSDTAMVLSCVLVLLHLGGWIL